MAPPTDRESALDQLYAAPLTDFVAERKRLAAELRKAGDREAAGEIAKSPKPTAPAWSLNALVREEDEAAGAWLAAVDALREASTKKGGDLRAAMAEHRDATVALVEAAGGRAELSAPMRERVRALLQGATMDASLAEALRAGRVEEAREAPEADATDAAPAAPAEPRRSPSPPPPRQTQRGRRKADEQGEKRRREAERKAELEARIAEADEALAEQREAAEAAHASVAAAEERLEAAEQRLHRSRSEAGAARAAAKEADRTVSAAERARERLRARAAR